MHTVTSCGTTRAPIRALGLAVAALIGLTSAVAGAAGTAVAADSTSTSVTGGTVDWGFKQSFRNYVSGGGSITTGGGATKSSDGTFRFQATSGSYDTATKELTATGAGSVEFDYRAHTFVITLDQPTLTLTPTSGSLVAGLRVQIVDAATGAPKGTSTSKRITLATVDVTKGTRSVTAGKYSWSGLPTAITAEGAKAFAADISGTGQDPTEFYSAGTALDPVSVDLTGTWPAEGETPDAEFSEPGVSALAATRFTETTSTVSAIAADPKRGQFVVQSGRSDSGAPILSVVDEHGTVVHGGIDGVTTGFANARVDPNTGDIIATTSLPATTFGGDEGSWVSGAYVVIQRGADAAYDHVVYVKPSIAVSPSTPFSIDPADGSIVTQAALDDDGGSAGLVRVSPLSSGTLEDAGVTDEGAALSTASLSAERIADVDLQIAQVAVDWTSGRAAVTDQYAGKAAVVDLATGSVVSTLSIGAAAQSGLAGDVPVDADGRAWLSNDGDQKLRALSLRGTPAVTATIDRVGTASYLAVDTARGLLWASGSGDTTAGNVLRAYRIGGTAGTAAKPLEGTFLPGNKYVADPIQVTSTGTVLAGTANTATGSAKQGLREVAVVTTPTFTKQPADVSVELTGATTGADGTVSGADPKLVSFTTSVTGSPTPTVQWQQETPSGWADLQDGESVAGATSTTLRITATEALDGATFRAVATNTVGDTVIGRVASGTAKLTVTVKQPSTSPGTGAGAGGGSTVVGADGSITGAKNAAGASTRVKPATQITTAAAGMKLTVSGTGFSKNTNKSGLYVLFGYVTKFPAAGGSLGTGYDYVNGGGASGQEGQGFVAWPDNTATGGAATAKLSATKNGSFTQTGLTASATFTGASTKRVDCLSGAVQCGVITIGAHGLKDAALETFTPVYFAGQTVPGALPTTPTTGSNGGLPVIQPPVVQTPPAAAAPTVVNAAAPAPKGSVRPANAATPPNAAEPPTAPAADSTELQAKIDSGEIRTVTAAEAGIPDEATAGDVLEMSVVWSEPDQAGAIWTYSEPTRTGDFTVEDGRANGTVDTTGLSAGNHHIVLAGDAGTIVAIPIAVRDATNGSTASTVDSSSTTAAANPTDGGVPTETWLLVAVGFLGGIVIIAIAIIILLLTGVLTVRSKPNARTTAPTEPRTAP
ncbi:HtaA domain-containing protein [Curtobacterium sp. ME12]|uniref:HtaA domain-containing protein n=1 Tax=Curtobacterium sp. ME12 TaxID=2744253 RepID=UPI0021756586|nr:HtaA domain-containing protein [Curtobacterium sp. ME12]